jgi:hypothetical protein
MQAAAAPPSVSTAAGEANAEAVAAPPSVSTVAKEASAALVMDRASVSIITRGTIASVAAEQASASIVADATGARTVLLRPIPHHDVTGGCKARRMQVVDKHGSSGAEARGLDRGWHLVVEIKMRGRYDGSEGCAEARMRQG